MLSLNFRPVTEYKNLLFNNLNKEDLFRVKNPEGEDELIMSSCQCLYRVVNGKYIAGFPMKDGCVILSGSVYETAPYDIGFVKSNAELFRLVSALSGNTISQ